VSTLTIKMSGMSLESVRKLNEQNAVKVYIRYFQLEHQRLLVWRAE